MRQTRLPSYVGSKVVVPLLGLALAVTAPACGNGDDASSAPDATVADAAPPPPDADVAPTFRNPVDLADDALAHQALTLLGEPTVGGAENCNKCHGLTGPRLRETLPLAAAGQLPDATADGAVRRAARLAMATGHDEWYRLTFELAAAAQRRLDDKTIDELHAAMMGHKPVAAAALGIYAARFAGAEPDAQQHRRRLDALLRFCRA